LPSRSPPGIKAWVSYSSRSTKRPNNARSQPAQAVRNHWADKTQWHHPKQEHIPQPLLFKGTFLCARKGTNRSRPCYKTTTANGSPRSPVRGLNHPSCIHLRNTNQQYVSLTITRMKGPRTTDVQTLLLVLVHRCIATFPLSVFTLELQSRWTTGLLRICNGRRGSEQNSKYPHRHITYHLHLVILPKLQPTALTEIPWGPAQRITYVAMPPNATATALKSPPTAVSKGSLYVVVISTRHAEAGQANRQPWPQAAPSPRPSDVRPVEGSKTTRRPGPTNLTYHNTRKENFPEKFSSEYIVDQPYIIQQGNKKIRR